MVKLNGKNKTMDEYYAVKYESSYSGKVVIGYFSTEKAAQAFKDREEHIRYSKIKKVKEVK